MSSIYKIATDVSLAGPYLRQVSELSSLFGRLEKEARQVKKTFASITFGKGVTEAVGRAGKDLTSLEKISASVASGINKQLGGITLGTKPHQSITAFRDHLGALKTTGADVSSAIRNDMTRAFSTVKTEAATVRGAIGGWGQEVAAVETRVGALLNKMRGGLQGGGAGAGGRSIRRGGGHGGGVLDAIAMGPTQSGILAGLNVEHVGAGVLHKGGELQRQQNLYRMSGRSEEDVAAATRAAYKSSVLVPDVGVTESFKLLRELDSATQDAEGSRALLPQIAKTRSVLTAATGRENEEDMRRLFKFIELRGGAIDEKEHKILPKMFMEELDAATRALVVGQGLLTTNDLQQFGRQAGMMAKNIAPDDLYSSVLAAMEDQGGSRTGTALTAVGRQFIGGTMTSKVAEELNRVGMLSKEGQGWERNDKGKIEINDPSKAIKGYDVLTKQSFASFIDQVVRPTLVTAGITTKEAQNKEMYKFGSTDTGRRIMSLYLTSQEQIEAVGKRYKQAMGTDAYDKVLGGGKDFETAAKGLGEAFGTLKTALGDAKGIAPLLSTLATAIAGFADTLKDRPNIGTGVTVGVGGAALGAFGIGAYKTLTGFGLPAAATQLTTAAIALEAAAVKLGGGSIAKDVAQAAPLAGFGLPGIVAGTVAAGALGIYAQSKMMPDLLKQRGPGAFDPATGTGVDTNPMSGMAPDRPWLMDWWKKHAPTILGGDALKEEAAKVGKAAGVATTTSFGGEDFSGAGAKAGTSIIAGFLSVMAKLGGSGEGATPINFSGGGLGGLIQKASFGGSNDNIGGGGVARALGRGGGGGPMPSLPGAVQMTDDERNKLGLILRYESHGQNTMNYMGKRQGLHPQTAKGYTAQGYFQMLNSNWRRIAPGLGITAPNAMAGSLEDQTRVALHLLRNGGIKNWSNYNPALRGALSRGERALAGGSASPPTVGPPPRQKEPDQKIELHVDGRRMTEVVVKRMASAAKYPNHVGGMDTHGGWRPPGTTLTDAA